MKGLLIVVLLVSFGVSNDKDSQNLSAPCEVAIRNATKVHWDYINGDVNITQSYNARIKAEKICGFKL